MRKYILASLTLITSAVSYANYLAEISGGYFYDNEGQSVMSANYVVLAYDDTVDLSSFILNSGDSFADSSWMNEDSGTGIFALSVDSFSDGTAYSSLTIDNDLIPLNGDEKIAIITWVNPSDNSSFVIEEGASYCVFSPTLVPDEPLSGGDAWQLSPDNTGAFQFYFASVGAGGDIPNSYLTLSKVVVPEPAAMAAIFGALALAMALWRRAK